MADTIQMVPLAPPSQEVMQSWRLQPTPPQTNQLNLGCCIVGRNAFRWTLAAFLAAAFVAGIVILVVLVPRHHHHSPLPDNYTLALRKALVFFNEQKSGKLPKDNNVFWRGDSCVTDGNPNSIYNDLSGGYYDGGDTIKANFPQAFAITMMSWSVIEYGSKYEAAGELAHVKELIKWGADYFLKTFDSGADTIDAIVIQVGEGDTSEETPSDRYCWMRPEDVDYDRDVFVGKACSDLAAEMAASLAAASIVFKDDTAYSQKLVHGATTVFEFATGNQGSCSNSSSDASLLYNSSSYWDEFVWGAAWMFYATGNTSYLTLATDPTLAKQAGAFSEDPDYGVLSWDNKLAGAQVLLSRLRIFLGPGYPYEEILSRFQKNTDIVMCSYLPYYTSFNRTKGGLIQLNHGRSRPLQYVVNAAFLASLYSDYLEASSIPGWYCGSDFYTIEILREYAAKQINYILGDNPRNMSYMVGFGNDYPKHVHHRAASIPKNKIKYSCEGGYIWRDSSNPNPNILEGAMVAGPDQHDGFHDVRTDDNYTEPTIAGNAGLVAALVSLSGDKSLGIDRVTMFSEVPPMFS